MLISPLTFLQIYGSAETIIDSLLEGDATTRYFLADNPQLRTLARFTAVPLYYHLTTSGYSASVDGKIVGWVFVRGRYQILYIDTLVVSPLWRRKGIAKMLMNYVEQQAFELHREWLGLTVTVTNEASLKLYEGEGYQRSHWHVFRGQIVRSKQSASLGLRRLWGFAAERAYRRLVTRDVYAGDPWFAPAENRFLTLEPYRQRGKEWALVRDGEQVAYFNHYFENGIVHLYIAADPRWWGSPDIVESIGVILGGDDQATMLQIRLASSGHHQAMFAVSDQLGLNESPAVTMRMFKRLDGQPSLADISAGII